MFKDIATLYYTKEVRDQDGFPIKEKIETKVFANKKSVKRTEFYSAMQVGMQPNIVFELRIEDWELTKHTDNNKILFANKVEFEGGIYDIIRTYEKDNSIIELVCG